MAETDQNRKTRRIVVKIGSALLTRNGKGLDTDAIREWVGQMAALHGSGHKLLLVTSGAVAVGMQRMGVERRPHALNDQQALAAIGQMGLVQTYETAFQQHNLHTAQVLLTHDDMTNRKRYLNARSTLHAIMAMGVLPVINENDTVATDEIRFGDNDTLAAMVANLVEADLLVILTDQDGLYDKDPRTHGDARLIQHGQAGDPALMTMAGDSGTLGRGGMVTKVKAAEKAARSGTTTIIAHGRTENVIQRLVQGETIGTRLESPTGQLAARKRWLAGHTRVGGKLVLDDGAVRVLRESGRSLLAVGVTAVEGDFSRGELVACVGADGKEVARGLVNYNADESRRIAGKGSDQIESLLGYVDEAELIHRDNMVLI